MNNELPLTVLARLARVARMKSVRSWVWVAFLILLMTLPAMACPNCKDALAQEGADGDAWSRQANGFFWSILFMLGMLFMGGFSLIRLLVRAGADVATLPVERVTENSPEARDKVSKA